MSIGLPVYNGERFLAQAVDTLLAQEFEDLELCISDNGSIDGTEEMCRDYAARDPRVRYERHSRNRGAAWNYTYVRDMASPAATYFKWSAADDEHDPKYLSRTVEILDRDRSISLAHTGTADIDEEAFVLKVWHQQVARLESDDPAERLRDLVNLRHECFEAFGLIRHDVVRATRGLGAFTGADNVLVVEIALRGRIVHDEEVLFRRRQHADRSMVAFADERSRITWFDPEKSGQLTLPAVRLGLEFARAIRDAPLTAGQRRRCYSALSVYLRCNWPNLVKNVVRSSVELPRVVAARIGGP